MSKTALECVGFHSDRDRKPESDLAYPQDRIVHRGAPIFCETHQRQIRDCLAEMPNLYVALHHEALDALGGSHGSGIGTRITTSRNSPSPSPMVDESDALSRWLCEWEDQLRRVLGEMAAPHTSSGRATALLEAQRWLSQRLPRLLRVTPWAEEFGLDLMIKHQSIMKKLKRERLVHRLDVPCPSCDLRALIRADGDSAITCTNCHRIWTEIEYERLIIVAITGHDT